MASYCVTFATLNCLDYTRQCVDSLIQAGVDPQRIVAVDNASSDGTPSYLKEAGLGQVILNKNNLSCGVAWNQGILAQQADWTVVMNNDAIVTRGFVDGLIAFALEHQLKLVSPARIDGPLDYDFSSFAETAQQKTRDAVRWGASNAICMCMHWSLFQQIGFFRADPSLLGFEDGLFYNAIRRQGIPHATTGRVWIHHFGSVTQEHLKTVLGIGKREVLVKHNDRQLLHQSWLERKLLRYQLKRSHRRWRADELARYGMTLHGERQGREFVWL